MNMIRTSLIAVVSALSLTGVAHAQSSTTGTTSQSEMNRGVPGVDVDAGKNAKGALDVDRANTEKARGVPGVDVDTGKNARGAVDVNAGDASNDTRSNSTGMRNNSTGMRNNDTGVRNMREPRADRN